MVSKSKGHRGGAEVRAQRVAKADAAEDTGPKAQMNLQFSMLNADSR